jgi:hypothetical protein
MRNAHHPANEREAVTVPERLGDLQRLGPDGDRLAKLAERSEALGEDASGARGREHQAKPVPGGQIVVQRGNQWAEDCHGVALIEVHVGDANAKAHLEFEVATASLCSQRERPLSMLQRSSWRTHYAEVHREVPEEARLAEWVVERNGELLGRGKVLVNPIVLSEGMERVAKVET